MSWSSTGAPVVTTDAFGVDLRRTAKFTRHKHIGCFEQAFGFQSLDRLRHGSLGQAEIFGDRLGGVRVAVGMGQIMQGALLDGLEVEIRPGDPRFRADQVGDAFDVILEMGVGHYLNIVSNRK